MRRNQKTFHLFILKHEDSEHSCTVLLCWLGAEFVAFSCPGQVRAFNRNKRKSKRASDPNGPAVHSCDSNDVSTSSLMFLRLHNGVVQCCTVRLCTPSPVNSRQQNVKGARRCICQATLFMFFLGLLRRYKIYRMHT